MKKSLSILSVMILLSILIYSAALGEVYGDWEYSSSDGKTCTIKKYRGSETEVTVPSVLNGYEVTRIGSEAFYNCSSLVSVEIPEGLTSISFSAFSNCSRLMNVSLPIGITSIAYKTFNNCSSLTSVEIPESVTSIEDYAFCDCSSLTSIEIPKSVTSIGDFAFYNCSCLISVKVPDGVTSIGCSVFCGCSSLTSVTIPKSVTSIGDFAFDNCSSLMNVKIPESVSSIGGFAFYNCSSLTSIEIPKSVTSIESYTFCNCNKMMNIRIPENVTSIGDRAFQKCSNLTRIEIPKSVTSIGDSVFSDCSSLTGIEIPESLTSIGSFAFSGCSSLMDIEIPGSVTNIGNFAFSGCSSLTGIVIPESVTSIGSSTFEKCSSLTNIEIPYGVTSIGSYAFRKCSSLTNVEIPESVTSIGFQAFCDCSSLMKADLPDGIITVGSGAFSGCNAKRYCSIGSNTAYALSKAGYSFRDKGNKKLAFKYEYEQDEITGLKVIDADEDIIEATIPEGVTSIGNSAFYGCRNLTSIEIPEGVTSIGFSAFSNCSGLTGIEIPESVTSIGDYAFNSCSSLTEVDLPDGIITVGSYAFLGCNAKLFCNIGSDTAYALSKAGYSFVDQGFAKLHLRYVFEGENEKGLTVCGSDMDIEKAVFPEEVTIIGSSAFNGCRQLHSLIIPEGVKTLENRALSSSYLKKVLLPKSIREIGSSAVYRNTTIYCYEFSYAESWARDNGYKVVLIDGKSFSEIGSIDIDNTMLVLKGADTPVKADIFPLLPEVKVEWTSSDPEIFTVKDGVITGRKNGTATLTVTAGDLSTKSEVTVVTAAEDFTLEDIFVPAKGTAEAIVTGIVPADATLDMEWSTEDSVVASVTEEGLVTGKALGDTTLTAVDSISGLERTASVHVIGPISRVEFEQESAEMIPLERRHLTVTAYSGEYTFQNQLMTYTSDNESIAVVDEKGFVQAKSAGEATITAQTASGAKASCRIIVYEPTIMLIPASATEIAAGAFEGTGAELYVIPETTKTIGARAFADMEKARVIVLPEGIEADPTAFDGTDATFIRPDGTAVQ